MDSTIRAVSVRFVPLSMLHFCRYLCASSSVRWFLTISTSFASLRTFSSSALLTLGFSRARRLRRYCSAVIIPTVLTRSFTFKGMDNRTIPSPPQWLSR